MYSTLVVSARQVWTPSKVNCAWTLVTTVCSLKCVNTVPARIYDFKPQLISLIFLLIPPHKYHNVALGPWEKDLCCRHLNSDLFCFRSMDVQIMASLCCLRGIIFFGANYNWLMHPFLLIFSCFIFINTTNVLYFRGFSRLKYISYCRIICMVMAGPVIMCKILISNRVLPYFVSFSHWNHLVVLVGRISCCLQRTGIHTDILGPGAFKPDISARRD